jgi:hypothetical protein
MFSFFKKPEQIALIGNNESGLNPIHPCTAAAIKHDVYFIIF